MLRDDSLPDSSSSVCMRAIEIGQNFEQKKWELADLLYQIQADELWRPAGAESFADFVVTRVRISTRTAQELLRMRQKCEALGIPRETIDELGWSKLALVASRLDPSNCQQLLSDVKNLSISKLRDKYQGQSSGRNRPKRDTKVITITSVMLQAICRASERTRTDDTRTNLEYVCRSYCEHMMAFRRLEVINGN